MSSIGVFFNDPKFEDYPFTEEDYRSSYRELGLTLRAKNAEMIVVRGRDTYRGGNRFQGGWRFTGEGYERVDGEIEVDVIYNKGSELVTDASSNVVNHPGLDAICRDKMRSYETFPEHFPKTILVKDLEQGRSALLEMRTDSVVLKPADGWGGKKVWIGPKAEAAEYFEPYPVMLQELIDTSGGIPGAAPGTHDFRLVMANDRVILTYVRMPADGKFVSNVSKGGSVLHVPAEVRPLGALRLAEAVDSRFREFGSRLYCIDCGKDRDGTWKIIELNDQPGLSPRSDCGAEADTYYAGIADLLIAAAENR